MADARLGDRERTELQETGWLRLYGRVSFAEIVALVSDLGIDPATVSIKGVSNIHASGIVVEVEQ